jgi:two-component system LytT family response regulator
MNHYKTIVIEDEKRAQILLKSILEQNFPNIQIMDICDDLPTGVKSILKHKPDFVFLDIEMPHFSGLEILDFFEPAQVQFSIIFTTAYHHYAIEALKLSAVDYLLKPINKDDVIAAVDRYEKTSKHHKTNTFSSLKSMLTDQKIDKIAVPEGSQLHFISPETIMYIKADNSYSELYLKDGSKMIVSRSIKNFEEGLKHSNQFFRVHKSFLINTQFIKKFDKSNGGWVSLSNGAELPVSSEKTNEFLSLIHKITR